MAPGTLAINLCYTNFYSTQSRLDKRLHDDGIPIRTPLLTLSHLYGTWVQILWGDRIGWVNSNVLKEI
jgi:hypothetical protein